MVLISCLAVDGTFSIRLRGYINEVEIRKDLSQRERMVDFISQIKNPYCYLDKGMVVKISFAGENRLEDTLKKCARTHRR